ncbi:hypothetical protein MSWAN_0548 [Methanobacterium paludis]|uniref:Uncharacterized protein n=2 Tax=Methanobacterium paludis (strain DSM 25820 / JCM 18151 / SWAN1) TaxID=868131 RepID=F6D551_METPW|nr:hypothetical protein MSWAN_0548 [Methanobacterium paludis]
MVGAFIFSVIIFLIVILITGKTGVIKAVVIFLTLLVASEVISLAIIVKMARSKKLIL